MMKTEIGQNAGNLQLGENRTDLARKHVVMPKNNYRNTSMYPQPRRLKRKNIWERYGEPYLIDRAVKVQQPLDGGVLAELLKMGQPLVYT